MFVRENEILPALDAWLSKEFAPHRIEETIEARGTLATAEDVTGHHQALAQAHTTIRDCESKMVRYRAAIDAGGDLQEITQWINAVKAERTQAEVVLRTMPAPARMSREDVRAIIEQFTSLAAIIGSADPADKAGIYQGLNLMLTYQPATQTVRAEARLTVDSLGLWFVSEGRAAAYVHTCHNR